MKTHKVIDASYSKRKGFGVRKAIRQTRKILMRKLREAELRDEA